MCFRWHVLFRSSMRPRRPVDLHRTVELSVSKNLLQWKNTHAAEFWQWFLQWSSVIVAMVARKMVGHKIQKGKILSCVQVIARVGPPIKPIGVQKKCKKSRKTTNSCARSQKKLSTFQAPAVHGRHNHQFAHQFNFKFCAPVHTTMFCRTVWERGDNLETPHNLLFFVCDCFVDLDPPAGEQAICRKDGR